MTFEQKEIRRSRILKDIAVGYFLLGSWFVKNNPRHHRKFENMGAGYPGPQIPWFGHMIFQIRSAIFDKSWIHPVSNHGHISAPNDCVWTTLYTWTTSDMVRFSIEYSIRQQDELGRSPGCLEGLDLPTGQ